MTLKDIRQGQDCLMRAVRHLANRAAILRDGKAVWASPSPEADADGIMTRLFEQLDVVAQRNGEPKRGKACPRRKKKGAAE